MKSRKLRNYEHLVVVAALLSLIDSIKDLELVSVEQFRSLGGDYLEYALSLSNEDVRHNFKNLDYVWEGYNITEEPVTLLEYLNSILESELANDNEKRFLIFNNGLLYLLSTINNQLDSNSDFDKINL